jgi:uncharacterized RmlC-like cupin family protein
LLSHAIKCQTDYSPTDELSTAKLWKSEQRERGEYSVTVRAGDFLHVPAWLVHREINWSKEFPFRWVVISSTSEPIGVNLAEDAWK